MLFTDATPFEGVVNNVYESVFPSISKSFVDTFPLNVTSSLAMTVSFTAVGGSLTFSTVMNTVSLVVFDVVYGLVSRTLTTK